MARGSKLPRAITDFREPAKHYTNLHRARDKLLSEFQLAHVEVLVRCRPARNEQFDPGIRSQREYPVRVDDPAIPKEHLDAGTVHQDAYLESSAWCL